MRSFFSLPIFVESVVSRRKYKSSFPTKISTEKVKTGLPKKNENRFEVESFTINYNFVSAWLNLISECATASTLSKIENFAAGRLVEPGEKEQQEVQRGKNV